MSDETPDTTGLREAVTDPDTGIVYFPDDLDDPTPEPDAGDVSLTDADDVALADWWVGEGGDYEDLALDSLTQVVERILASHVAAAREAVRAEAAEATLADLVAKIEALADEWEAADADNPLRQGSFGEMADELCDVIPADAATAFDAVRAEVWDEGHRAGYEDRRSETQFIRFVSENPYRHTPEDGA